MSETKKEVRRETAFFFEHLFPLLKKEHERLGWPDITADQVTPTYMKALTNMTFKVECSIPGTKPLLAKKFGKGFVDELLERSLDNQISENYGLHGVGPKVLFYTEDIRVEEFLESDEFTFEHMHCPRMRNMLAYYISKLHNSNPPVRNKKSMFTQIHNNDIKIVELFKEASEMKKDLYSEDEKKKVSEISSLIEEGEINWLKDQLAPFDTPENVVPSHNDLLNGNILCLKDGSLKLIDFEYTTFNFRMFDFGNFVNESLIDYSKPSDPYFELRGSERPSMESLHPMVKYYLFFSGLKDPLSTEELLHLVDNPKEVHEALIARLGDEEALATRLRDLEREIELGYLVSHYYWILWGVIMSKNPDIKFNYIEFAYQRYQDYCEVKNNLNKH